MSCRFVDSFPAVPSWSCSKAGHKPVWHIPLLSVQWINSWVWADELSETCRVSCQNKFVKLVHLGIIIKKFVTMHGHTNAIYLLYFQFWKSLFRVEWPCMCWNFRYKNQNKLSFFESAIKSRSMTGLGALGIREPIRCQLCKSGHKSISFFGDKLNSPNWQSLKLSLSLSRESQVFCCHDGRRRK